MRIREKHWILNPVFGGCASDDSVKTCVGLIQGLCQEAGFKKPFCFFKQLLKLSRNVSSAVRSEVVTILVGVHSFILTTRLPVSVRMRHSVKFFIKLRPLMIKSRFSASTWIRTFPNSSWWRLASIGSSCQVKPGPGRAGGGGWCFCNSLSSWAAPQFECFWIS